MNTEDKMYVPIEDDQIYKEIKATFDAGGDNPRTVAIVARSYYESLLQQQREEFAVILNDVWNRLLNEKKPNMNIITTLNYLSVLISKSQPINKE
jgi:hypothetical protein